MAIQFDWYENPPRKDEAEDTPRLLHPRIHYNGSYSTRNVADEIHHRCTLTHADITACLIALGDLLGERLADGQKVHLEGIGYFYPTLTTSEPVTAETKLKTGKVRIKGIEFQADKALKRKMQGAKVAPMHAHAPGQNPTDEEIMRLLEEYFSTHSIMRRINFHYLTGMPESTCRVYLRRLREAGILKNEGSRLQPIYTWNGGDRPATLSE